MNTLFTTLDSVLLDGESLTFRLSRENGVLKSVVEPHLVKEPKDATDDIKQIRANLSMPLLLTMPAHEMGEAFLNQLSQYGEARKKVSSNLDVVLDSLKEAEKAAKVSKVKIKGGSPHKASNPGSSDVVAPDAPPKPAERTANPASL